MGCIKLNAEDLENAKAYLLPFIDYFKDGMALINNDKRVVVWNNKAVKLTGLDLPDIASLSCKQLGLYHFDKEGNLLCDNNCPIDDSRRTSKCIFEEVILKCNDNIELAINLQVIPVKNLKDENLGFLTLFNHKQLDNDLNLELIRLKNKVDDYGEITKELIYKNNDLNEKLLRLSNTDMLTNLNNRRYFYHEAQKQLDRSERYDQCSALVMMDIDHFKKINDTYGHLIGDKVLQDVAKIIIDSTRSSDINCRFGGEEFIVMFPHTDKEKAIFAAEKIRNSIEKFVFEYDDQVVPVTLSIGVALSHKDNVFKGLDLSKFVDYADRALYNAKELGRNRVVFED